MDCISYPYGKDSMDDLEITYFGDDDKKKLFFSDSRKPEYKFNSYAIINLALNH